MSYKSMRLVAGTAFVLCSVTTAVPSWARHCGGIHGGSHLAGEGVGSRAWIEKAPAPQTIESAQANKNSASGK
jgi:hypothetical protein